MIIIILLNICRSDLQVFFPTSVTQSPAGLKGHVETSLETHLSLMAWGTQAYAYHLICWYIYKYKCIRNTHTHSQWWLVNRMMNAVAWRRPELQRFVFEISFSRWKHTPVVPQHAQSCTVSGKESSNRTSTAFTGSSGRLIFVETHFPFVISTGISVCVCWVLCVGVGHTHTYTRAHSSGSSCYLCVFNRTKDASSHVQMLLYRPAFLSFQKPSLQEKCLDFPFLCLLFSFFYTVSNVVLLFYFIFSYLSSMNFHCSYLWELGHGVNDRNARLRFYFLGFIIVIIIIYFCKRKKTP